MPYEIGTATDYQDLLTKLKTFLTSGVTCSSVTAESNTGDGTVSTGPAAEDDAPAETWTLTATSATNFTVSGSVSGSQAAATVGTAYDNNIVSFTITAGGTAFVSGDSFTFTTTVVMGEDKYTVDRWNTDYDGNGNYEMIIHGPGSSSGDAIYSGIVTAFNVSSDWYNWYINGFTGFDSGLDFLDQAGSLHNTSLSRLPQVCLSNTGVSYWVRATGRAFTLCTKVSTVYEAMYMGWILPYANPIQHPYPYAMCGSYYDGYTGSDQRWSSVENMHRGFPDPYIEGWNHEGDYHACGYLMEGTRWVPFGNRDGSSSDGVITPRCCTWPYVNAYANQSTYPNYAWRTLCKNLDDTYPLFPIHVLERQLAKNTYGTFEGCFAIPGLGLNAEDVLSYSGTDYVVFPVNHHTDNEEYWAMRLD